MVESEADVVVQTTTTCTNAIWYLSMDGDVRGLVKSSGVLGADAEMIRNVQIEDAESICAIYNHYVRETIITFEEQPVSTSEMQRRIREQTDYLPWIVFAQDDTITGYAYGST